MASKGELLRTEATDREIMHKRRHLRTGSRITESMGSSGKREYVMIPDPRMGTAPQTISQSL